MAMCVFGMLGGTTRTVCWMGGFLCVMYLEFVLNLHNYPLLFIWSLQNTQCQTRMIIYM